MFGVNGSLTKVVLTAIGVLALVGCKNQNFTPKPEGYPRIQLPERNYQTFDTSCPFTFKYPTYGEIKKDKKNKNKPCWLNIHYKPLGARLYLSYRQFEGLEKLQTYRQDARKFVYKHTVKANRIQENAIKSSNASGTFYELGGNTATALQFFVTDSSQHFIRGSLYFNTKPNRDSLRPAIQFLKKDLLKMVKTLDWKDVPKQGMGLK
jgi:gliding motility-associated lipoprotein GldD